MENQQLIPHLFRTEFRKIVSVLCKHFGIAHVETAEDIASETFLAALESWSYHGIPDNPVAWLYKVAKNKTINFSHRQETFAGIVAQQLSTDKGQIPELDLSEKNITDSQLQMLFTICDPVNSPETQVALALRILCGFGIEEIANAFLTTKETINKRLYRAKERLRLKNISIDVLSQETIATRLSTVLKTLYLLFNEGYYSESHDCVLREDLCAEAMRLTHFLVENGPTNSPEVNAMLSLMCFHASRFAARRDANGDIVLYGHQDPSEWNELLIQKGVFHLHEASRSAEISTYHLEAAIAFWHTRSTDSFEKWSTILQLYNQLLTRAYSPIAALNRTYALAKLVGKRRAIPEAEKLQLNSNHYYHTLLGELHTEINNAKAKLHFEKALCIAKTQADKKIIMKKIDGLFKAAPDS